MQLPDKLEFVCYTSFMWLFRSTIVLLVFFIINIYTGLKVFSVLRFFLPSLRAFVFWPPFIILCNFFLLIHLLRLDRIQFLRQISMYSLPVIIYFFLGLLVLDTLVFALRLFKNNPSPAFTAAGTGLVMALVFLVLLYGSFHARNIQTVNYSINLSKDLADRPGRINKLQAVLVSDMHIGRTVDMKWLAKIVDTVNEARPDIIFIAGDIFDNNIQTLNNPEGTMAELKRFSAPLGVYACPGNHDVDRLSLRETVATNRIQTFLKDADIILLQDEVILLKDSLYLIGRRDASNRGYNPSGTSRERKSAAELTVGLDLTLPVIFLDHQPTDFISEELSGADLILSGHTHKGQFFPGNIATAYLSGKNGSVHYGYWKGSSAQAVVSSGAGVWGPPFRIATNSEIAVLNIKF